MKFFTTSYLLMSFVLLASCSSKNEKSKGEQELEGTISISGAFALYPLTNVWAEEFQKEYPGIRLNISAGGAGKGMADVLSGSTDLGMFSRSISQEEQQHGAWWVAVTKDAVLPTINVKNPFIDRLKVNGLTRNDLAELFLGDGKKHWKNSSIAVDVYTRSDAAGAADVWATYLGGEGQEAIKGIAVFGDPGVADAVKRDVNGIGFNNVIYVYDITSGVKYPGLDVVPIDINENGKIDPEEQFYDNLQAIDGAIADGRYPSPPARELYLISRGVPSKPEVIAFLNWILNQGQGFISQNGYIRLSKQVIDDQKKKLENGSGQ